MKSSNVALQEITKSLQVRVFQAKLGPLGDGGQAHARRVNCTGWLRQLREIEQEPKNSGRALTTNVPSSSALRSFVNADFSCSEAFLSLETFCRRFSTFFARVEREEVQGTKTRRDCGGGGGGARASMTYFTHIYASAGTRS